MFKKSVRVYDIDQNSFMLQAMMTADLIPRIIQKCICNLALGESLHFSGRLLRILLTEKIIYSRYLDLELIGA